MTEKAKHIIDAANREAVTRIGEGVVRLCGRCGGCGHTRGGFPCMCETDHTDRPAQVVIERPDGERATAIATGALDAADKALQASLRAAEEAER